MPYNGFRASFAVAAVVALASLTVAAVIGRTRTSPSVSQRSRARDNVS
jgi:hypothetical protein